MKYVIFGLVCILLIILSINFVREILSAVKIKKQKKDSANKINDKENNE